MTANCVCGAAPRGGETEERREVEATWTSSITGRAREASRPRGAGVVRRLRWLRRCVDVSRGQKINDVVCGVRRKGAVRCAEVATSRKIDGNVDTLHVEEIGINDLWWIMSLDLTLYEIYCISIVVKGIIVPALYSRSLFLSAGLEEIMPDK
jgi:hypothetical protein